MAHESVKNLDWTFARFSNDENITNEDLDFSRMQMILRIYGRQLDEIKRYIDGIIECNLPLHTSQFSTTLHDCGCLTRNNVQEERMQILKDLSSCFYFLATDNYINKKNHISLTLNNWASLLYERMRWY